MYEASLRVNMPEHRAGLLAELLTACDLRGVLSHGSQQLPRYVHEIRDKGINPDPNVQIIKDTSNTLTLDGDGGLGYYPAYEGTQRLMEKAREHGMAMLVTRNHGHIGAAGIYTRLAAEHGLAAFATSGVQMRLRPEHSVFAAAPSPPMSFSLPAGEEPPLVLDANVTHWLDYTKHDDDPRLKRRLMQVVLRMIGMGTVCQAWGGLLTGLPADAERAVRTYRNAHQGALLFMFDPGLFIEPDRLGREMDEFAQRMRQLKPIEGSEGAFLPGHVESEREKKYRREGIPLSETHYRDMEILAASLGLTPPWD